MKRQRELFSLFLVLSTIGSLVAFAAVREKSWTEALQPYAMSTAMLIVLGAVLGMNWFQRVFQNRQLIMGGLFYGVSVLAIALLPEDTLSNWWLIGPVAAALYLHLYLGITLQCILTYLLCSLYDYSIEYFIFYGMIGIILCVLSRWMTNLKSLGYVMIIVLTSNLTLTFVMNNFVWKQATGKSAWSSLISIGLIVILAYLLPWKQEQNPLYIEPEIKPLPEKNTANPSKDLVEETDDALLAVLSEGFPLRQMLLEHSEKLYQHSLYISSMAQEAALCVGCNDKIVQAGGLYHEVGRIEGRDYIEEGVKLGEAYGLPKPVIDIIRQHNSKYEKPQSMEAAVVMITDSIVSTIEYMEKEQAGKQVKVSPDKIIEQIFDIRLAKGTLDESGMDIRNYKKLKEFFKNEYSKRE